MQESCPAGNSTEASLPMTDPTEALKKLYLLINRVQFLITHNGLPTYEKEEALMLETVEGINEAIVRDFSTFHKYLHQWNSTLFERKMAYQQLIHFVRQSKADIHLWKKILPCLCFGRLGKKELGQSEPWSPPVSRKEAAGDDNTKEVDTLPFLLSFYKKLKQKHEEGDTKAANELMQKLRSVLPFGSRVFLTEGLSGYQQKQKRISALDKEQRKLRYCAGVKLGHSKKRERMAEERFCTKHRRYLSKFRVPEQRRKNSMEAALEEAEKPCEESEDEEW